MSKRDYYEENKNIILNILKELVQEHPKDKCKCLIEDKEQNNKENMTDEQKQKIKEYYKKYYENMTDEQKQKKKRSSKKKI